jgi:hypothetical protein
VWGGCCSAGEPGRAPGCGARRSGARRS